MKHAPVVLIVEDQPEILDLAVLLIKSQFSVEVIEASSLKGAIDALKVNSEIQCVISDYDLSDGYSTEIYDYLKANQRDIPFILCTGTPLSMTAFKGKDKVAALIAKPFRSQELVSALKRELGEKGSIKESAGPKYHPVKVKTLLKVSTISVDVYIKLGEDRYVKIIRAGESLSEADYQKYSQKDVEYLYFLATDLNGFVDEFARDLFQIVQAKKLSVSEVIDVSTEAHELMYRIFQDFGASSNVEKMAQACTRMALSSIFKEAELRPHLSKLTFKKEDYLSTHSAILAQVCCMLASVLGLGTEMVGYKLAYASMIHDLSLDGSSISQMELALQTSTSNAHLEKNRQKIRDHIAQSVELVKKLPSAPSGVLDIIKAHHEGPKGSGFPDQLDAREFGILPSLFIMGHEITNYIWLMESNADIRSFIKDRGSFYDGGTFKKVYDAIVKN